MAKQQQEPQQQTPPKKIHEQPEQQPEQQEQQPEQQPEQPQHDSNYNEIQEYPYLPPQDEPRAVFVSTTLNTHLAVLISPLHNFSTLKQQICLEHFNCFPRNGRIIIKSISIRINNNYYDVSDTILLKSAFYEPGKPWVVLAAVWTPVGSSGLSNETELKGILPIEPYSKYGHGWMHKETREYDHGKKHEKTPQKDHAGLIAKSEHLISEKKHTEPSSQEHHEQEKDAIPTATTIS